MKIFLLNIAFFLSLNTFCQNPTNKYFVSSYIGSIQYYGDLNELKSNIDIRNFLQTKDPLFGMCVGKKFNNYFDTQLTIEAGGFKESKAALNLSTTTSFYQITQRIEADIFNLTHPYIPIARQKINTLVYVGLGINGFRSNANDIDNNLSLRHAQSTKLALSYGISFRYKITNTTSLNCDFGHNKIYSDIFDATIGEDKVEFGKIKDKKISSYKTALDMWAGLRVGLIFELNKL
ncbi:outer membrane beta-barrel protein [Emticicia sp. SJ17W-69]|uniref:outer membrane beta-barrel protein n=1 Tax=Emticicia sp. SJ17W-69 TaxID=3421657 RepID=UPI003EC0F298